MLALTRDKCYLLRLHTKTSKINEKCEFFLRRALAGPVSSTAPLALCRATAANRALAANNWPTKPLLRFRLYGHTENGVLQGNFLTPRRNSMFRP